MRLSCTQSRTGTFVDSCRLCKCSILSASVQAPEPRRLTGVNHKGSHGKISVIGGNKDFTGAPYFSAFSAMQAGADYGNVLCTEGAATAIKSYAPELIVIPCMLQEQDIPDLQVRSSANKAPVHSFGNTTIDVKACIACHSQNISGCCSDIPRLWRMFVEL